MKSAFRLTWTALLALGCMWIVDRSAQAVDFILADFENNGTGTGGPGTDFDAAPTDHMPACPGCWYEGAGQQTLTDLTQSTIGATHGTKSMKVDFIGRGAGGGEGTSDTHFATPVRVTWISTDASFIAIRNAASGPDAGAYTIEFDLTYDIPALRALNWLGPPVDFPAKPEKFIGMGIYKSANGDGGPYVHAALEQVLPTLINPFDAAFNGTTYLTRHSSVAFDDFQFAANPVTATQYELGFSVNGNWGTNPAANNTQAAALYIDNIVLRLNDPTTVCDLNGSTTCDIADFELFMGDHLKANPTYGDLVGNLGASGTNGKNDFYDYLEFERNYDLANGGSGALARAIAGVPEPGSWALALVGLWGGIVSGARRVARPRV